MSSVSGRAYATHQHLQARRLGGVAEDELPAEFLDTPESRPAGDASDGEQAASSSPSGSDEAASTSADSQDPG